MRLNELLLRPFGGAREPAAAPTHSPAVLARAARRARSRGWGLLASADFRRLWMIGVVAFAVRWLEMLVVGVFVYQRTGSAFDVALMTMLRMLPMALFGAFIGAWAERIERRSALIGVVAVSLATSVCLAVLAYGGWLDVWHLALASFVNGVAWAADNPVRRVMIGDVVGASQMSAAMSIDVGANNASRMLGPTIGGLLLAGIGISGAFTVSVLCYSVALSAAIGLRYRNSSAPSATGGAVLARMIEGLMLVRRDPRLIGTLVITVIYNVFGWPFTSMIPVIGQDSLQLGARGIGILASMDGVGAFCGALLIAFYARPAHYTRLYIGGVIGYLVMLIAFALVPNVPLAGAALLLTGLTSSAFSVMQATLIYLAAPAEMRSRLYGVLSVCIGIGPLGFLWLGLSAELIGAPAATALTGALGLLALALTRRWWGRLALRM
ncbi:MAG: MFS transporter [Alphaproteobacteria bacterium]|nr:MFS transporter [Alphaproteobacteria bacterium]